MSKKLEQQLEAAKTELLRSVEERFVLGAFPGVPAVKALPPEEAQICARRGYEEIKSAKSIDQVMRKKGLTRMPERARAYAPFSRKLCRAKTLVIVPYNSPDPNSRLIGGLGLCEDHANGVIVELDGTKVVNFITIDIIQDKLTEKQFSAKELIELGPEKFIEDLPREPVEPDITVDTASSAANETFRVLLRDEFSAGIYTGAEMQGLLHNAPIISAIAELQFLRLKGLASSPASSCCCCCCCCWGSCSSCSAVSTSYINQQYYQWTAKTQNRPTALTN